MRVEVGYIKQWRRAVFFTVVFVAILFGIVSTICKVYVKLPFLANVIQIAMVLVGIVLVLLVLADKWNRYTDYGEAEIRDGRFLYSDKKRKLNLPLADIKRVDIKKITLSSENSVSGMQGKVLAYKLMIETEKKKYYIESDRAQGREYNEVDLHRLYLMLMEQIR